MSDGARDAAHGLGARRDLSAHLSPPSPSRPWRTIDHAVVVGFLAVLVVPSTLFLTGVRPPEIENRPLLTPPPITVAGIVDPAWYQDVDRYVSDNLALRAPAVRAVAVVENEILGGTSNPEVIRGAGSWLFAAAEMRPTCELSAADVLARVDQTAEALQATGRPFRFLPIPDKHAIYPEAVRQDSPVPTPCTDLERPTMQSGVQARSGIAIDGWALLAPLRALDPTLGSLYFDQDSHWKPRALAAEVQALVDSLRPGVWNDADAVPQGVYRSGQELARLLGLSRDEKIPDTRLRPDVKAVETDVPVSTKIHAARAVFDFKATGNEPMIGGRTLIVYDSFFGNYIDRVARFFDDSVWIHVDDLTRNPSLATEVGPVDRVIFERVERELYRTRTDVLFQALTGSPG